jgi:hypothetical protein
MLTGPALIPLAAVSAYLLLLALPVGFFALLLLVGRFEKRLAAPYVAVLPEELNARSVEQFFPPYVVQMSQDLTAAGFIYGGAVRHAKPSCKIVGTIWASPDRRILAISGSGTVLNMPARQTWLITPLRDGRLLVTTDQNDEGDPSGIFLYERRLNALGPELLRLHFKRLERCPFDVEPAADAPTFDLIISTYRRRAERMIDLGRAEWLDAEHRWWRHTWRGAACVCFAFIPQALGAIPRFWRVHYSGAGKATLP